MEYLARKILLRFPYHYRVKKIRTDLKLSELRYNVANGNWHLVDQVAEKDGMIADTVGKAYRDIDKDLSAIKGGDHWIARALRDSSIAIEIKNIANKDLMNLETDSFICQAIAGKGKHSESGVIHLVGNTDTKLSEAIGILLYTVTCGPLNAHEIARYHLAKKIKNSDQQQELIKVISTWPESIQKKANEATDEIKRHLKPDNVVAA
jgi:hypothetical protein